ncbi:helix-turn-helix domain-containing protein [Geminisphaera colitermitum]|uniref:helix-turn-helix domain-containing protein n=1 Tax=Geminisphaera colitermitum TaxID=1148786 RepID=UPI000158D506|nr:AraC family transcriptional regulator [Geminisphaera colitermitum]
MESGSIFATPAEELLQRVQPQVLIVRREVVGPEWRWDLLSPFWRLYLNDGAGAFVVERETTRRVELRAGVVYLLPAWVRVETGVAGGGGRGDKRVRHDYMHFYLNGIPATLHRRMFRRVVELEPDAVLRPLLVRWQRVMARGVQEAGPAGFAWAHALVNAALALAWERLPADAHEEAARWSAGTELVRPALECIDRRLADPPLNRELAALCHMGEDHFIREFRAAVGLTPARYGLERRIAGAAQWLTGTMRKVDDIAAAAGFADRFHFSRVFREEFGMAPVAYRRMHWRGPRA